MSEAEAVQIVIQAQGWVASIGMNLLSVSPGNFPRSASQSSTSSSLSFLSVPQVWASGTPRFSPESAHLTQGLSRPPVPHFQSSWGWRRLRDSPPGDTGRSTPRSSWPGVNVGLHSARSQCSQAESPAPLLCLQPQAPSLVPA